ncbi:hypothetical protein [Cellulophaga omnivescoria]|uniref:hypothetical protein n=1 Tax=Cellulophaga omnivescoria TaxID=1888890 RepID=UPI0022F01C92|nr:hypothetical protein [Cellulophaga omnivescoria]WBU88458.1 hypothetical protein PBN93_11305 [Cellulophaga omnivescoria]
MTTDSIKQKLIAQGIYHSDTTITNKPSVIGYEKKFKLAWMATQLNTFIVATDFKDEKITTGVINQHITEAFNFTKTNYTGWPRGLQSGIGVISILISTNVDEQAKEYCVKLKSGKKWAGFTIPVIYNPDTKEVHQFSKNPMWGRIYYPHFKKLINSLK